MITFHLGKCLNCINMQNPKPDLTMLCSDPYVKLQLLPEKQHKVIFCQQIFGFQLGLRRISRWKPGWWDAPCTRSTMRTSPSTGFISTNSRFASSSSPHHNVLPKKLFRAGGEGLKLGTKCQRFNIFKGFPIHIQKIVVILDSFWIRQIKSILFKVYVRSNIEERLVLFLMKPEENWFKLWRFLFC